MPTVSIKFAKDSFPMLVDRVLEGETFAITSDGQVVASLSPSKAVLTARGKPVALDGTAIDQSGELEGRVRSGASTVKQFRSRFDRLEIWVSDDFDEPLCLVPESAMCRYDAFMDNCDELDDWLGPALPLDKGLIERAQALIGDCTADPEEALPDDDVEMQAMVSKDVETVRRAILMDTLTVEERLLVQNAKRLASTIRLFGGWIDNDELFSYLNLSAGEPIEQLTRGDHLVLKFGECLRIPAFQFVPDTMEVWPQIKSLSQNNLDHCSEVLIRFLLTELAPGQTKATPLSLITANQISAEKLQAVFEARDGR